MRVLVTGANGFIGSNLVVRLAEVAGFEAVPFGRGDDPASLRERVRDVDAVVHLAGINRPTDPAEFESGNVGLTQVLCDAIAAAPGRERTLILASSSQAELDNPYGRSKLGAEAAVARLAAATPSRAVVFRLPNVFGKWCRPNYNSVVATFCHNIAHDLPVRIDDPAREVRLVYVDDVVEAFLVALRAPGKGLTHGAVPVEYRTTLGQLADQIRAFRDSRSSLVTEPVGTGFVRALYATYISYLPAADFAYPLPRHADPRGVFVEMLKTRDSGQFSYFTAHPGVTRGGHYHHSKSEKFLVIKGRARFRFRHLISGATHELDTTGEMPQVVETVPGWTHDITNVGDDELVVMLWANEIFDREKPDTYAKPL